MLGKYLVYNSPAGRMSARIVEIEAYIGQDDPACHAARGKTDRNAPMFGPGGFSYVYFIYGMYNCLNFVTEKRKHPAALLLRAAEPKEGIDLMRLNSPRIRATNELLNGPGKLCRSFGLTTVHTALDLTGNQLYLEDRNEPSVSFGYSPRIGIRVGADLPWRFFDSDSKALSRPVEAGKTK